MYAIYLNVKDRKSPEIIEFVDKLDTYTKVGLNEKLHGLIEKIFVFFQYFSQRTINSLHSVTYRLFFYVINIA